MDRKHILIVGSGSVGKRHARNLVTLGCRVSCVDPDHERQRELASEVPMVAAYNCMEEASKDKGSFDGVVIGSPPIFHVDQAITALDWRLPVLLEKPVSPDLKSALKLRSKVEKTKVPLLLDYTWRWWEPLQRVRQLLADKVIGRLMYVQFVMSAHLADWHPREDYLNFFMSRKSLGGGALLDESHWIDLMVWFFGMPRRLFARIEKISDLSIDTDDNVDMFVEYDGDVRVNIHLDLFGRPHEKCISFIGENGTIRWSAEPNQISIGREISHTWETIPYTCERNDMFIKVAHEFLSIMQGGSVKTCNIEDGVRVLRVIESARRSHLNAKMVSVGGDN